MIVGEDRNQQRRRLRKIQGKMEHSYPLFLLVILNVLLSVMPGICSRFPTLPDNCTCETRHGTYSLISMQRTGGPRFTEPGSLYKDWSYTYNPCIPYTLTSKGGVCNNVALCKYDTEGDPHVYTDIGEQRDVECEITADGKIALVYPIQNKDIPLHESRVILECNDSYADPRFLVIDEANLIFSLTSPCGCPNRCLPSPATTKAGPSPSSTKTSTSPSPGTGIKDWELLILLPSLAGFLVVAVCLACLWRQLSFIREAVMCRCCHCYGENRDPGRVEVTENSALIRDQQNDDNNRPVEHEDSGAKLKVKEPVQEEEGDAKEEYKSPGKDDMTFVV